MPTFIGKPVTIAEDKQLQVGDTLRDFTLTATDLSQKSLSDFNGKKKVISIVPSMIQVSAQLKHVLLTKSYQNWMILW